MTSALPPTDQPAPEPQAPARLRRSGTDRMIGGVSGGLAEYSGIDPVIWRVGFIALTLLGGSGLLIYLLLWVLMPPAPLAAGRQPNPVERFVDRLHTALLDTLGSRDRRP